MGRVGRAGRVDSEVCLLSAYLGFNEGLWVRTHNATRTDSANEWRGLVAGVSAPQGSVVLRTESNAPDCTSDAARFGGGRR